MGGHLEAVTAEIYANTWRVMHGVADVIRARRGSGPGDPMADLMFGYVSARVSRVAREKLLEAGLLTHVPWSGQRNFEVLDGGGETQELLAQSTFADDEVFMFLGGHLESRPCWGQALPSLLLFS